MHTHEEESAALLAVKEITYGSFAGMVSKVFEHPFDLTKVRLQSQVLQNVILYHGPVDCLKKTFHKEGFTGLYAGLPAPLLGAMAENASLFLSYSQLQNLIRRATRYRSTEEKLPLYLLAAAAAGAGAITSFLLTPIELVKCKMQVAGGNSASGQRPVVAGTKLPGPIAVFKSVLHTKGFTGLWLGHTGTFIRETGGTAAWFCTKEFVASLLVAHRVQDEHHHHHHRNTTLRPWESALSGACAGVAFNLSLFPADTVKSAMQTDSAAATSFWRTFVALYRKNGVGGLYAGCGITVARSIPSSAIIFLIYDELKKHFP